jgi:hypothetical protein
MTEGTDKITVAVDTSSNPYSHPWKCTPGGSSAITVAAGRLLTMRNESGIGVSNHPIWVRLEEAGRYAGGTVTVTAATGYIYGYMGKANAETMFQRDDSTGLYIDRTVPDGTLAVAFSENLPENTDGLGDEFCFVIAEVTLAAGVAAVSEQILTHNPTMWHIDMPPEA